MSDGFPSEADLTDDAMVQLAPIPDVGPDYRAGFVCLIGRPNAGKSTLTNALVGTKVAITSGKPQTTRHTIRGIVHRDEGQIVLVDTPGLHRPRTLLGKRLNELVLSTIADVDVVVFCIAADSPVGPGDQFIAQELADARTPVIAVVTKADTVKPQQMMEQLLKVQAMGDWAEIIPTSAVEDYQVEALVDLLLQYLPLSPPLYPAGELTDEPEHTLIAEFVREAALEGVRDELPHSLAVLVDEVVPRPDRPEGKELLDVRVHLFVERSSQKSIIIGTGGSRLREIGTKARKDIERLLGSKVYLDLHVKVAKEWQRDPKKLDRLGF